MVAQEAAPGQVTQLCQALKLSRATFYRYRKAGQVLDPDIALLDQMQRLALEFPSYGYRRITAQLQRDGWTHRASVVVITGTSFRARGRKKLEEEVIIA